MKAEALTVFNAICHMNNIKKVMQLDKVRYIIAFENVNGDVTNKAEESNNKKCHAKSVAQRSIITIIIVSIL